MGTWKCTRYEGDSIITVQVQFAKDGTFTELQDTYNINDSTYTYSASKGTYSVDSKGSTSGIVGTWGVNVSAIIWDDTNNQYVTTSYKQLLTFHADGTLVGQAFESTTGTFGLPTSEGTGTYTYNNGTLTVTFEGQQPQTGKIALYENR
ncbi:lipocalin family protein [Gracilinema caldarium]|uniref:lipocalin family protein n=1 Tax=Gracilinema caldarium TaxID=215591 RepID=UPI0026F130EB|nr:lipocalin family protein [Gracilinema caldarium]